MVYIETISTPPVSYPGITNDPSALHSIPVSYTPMARVSSVSIPNRLQATYPPTNPPTTPLLPIPPIPKFHSAAFQIKL